MDAVQLPQVGDEFLDRWTIEEEVGKGGFSVVYRAVDGEDRVAAIKILLPEEVDGVNVGYDEEIAERFIREAKLLEQLDSAYTINMWDFGKSASGLYYMVFEFIDGRSLFQEIKHEGALDEARVIHCLRQTLIGLQSAHELGILHRDIKPNNIMLFERDADPDRVKLVDFGIAKMFGEARQEPGMDLTAAGLLVGTPRYMSPEQLRNVSLGPPSDLYSLGLCAFEMLTGKKCIPGKDRMKILQLQISAESFRLPEWVAASAGLKAIVHKLVEKDLPQRYQSAEEALKDLELLAGDPGATGDTVYQTINDDALNAALEKAKADAPDADDATLLTTVNEADFEEAIAHASTLAANITGTPLDPNYVANSGNDSNLYTENATVDLPKPNLPPAPSANAGPGQLPPSFGSGEHQEPPTQQLSMQSPQGSGQFQQPPAYGSGQFQQPPAFGSGLNHAPPQGPAGAFQQGSPYGSGLYEEDSPSTWGAENPHERLELDYGAMRNPTGSGPIPPAAQPELPPPGPNGALRPSQAQVPTQQGRRGLLPDEKLSLVASVILPGLGHVLLDQTMKGFLLVALAIVGIGAVGLAAGLAAGALWVAMAGFAFVDMFLVIRARRRRQVGAFEFFPDFDQLL